MRESKKLYDLLHGSGKTLATAESCTAGAVASAIVSTPGASEYFKGGVVSYCNEVKSNLLGVDPATIEKYNVVSSQVATEMCLGAIEALGTDYAVALTGVAGPGGGTPEIPVGTIWIAYGTKLDIRTCRLTEDAGRQENLKNAVKMAIKLLCEHLNT